MIKLGVIADDFTGASDAASFLVKSGNKTLLLTDIDDDIDGFDCIVVALKIRSVASDIAIKEVKRVLDYFDKLNVNQIYYKYCSTFDSTPKGNIGVVMDYLLERYNAKYSLLCPSLPVNGRTVKNGVLYVNGEKLADSPLKDHPLNPMWDSYIPNIMKDQSKFKSYPIGIEEINNNTDQLVSKYLNTNERFYLVPDYYDDDCAKAIAEHFKDLKILSGGSGLLEYLYKDKVQDTITYDFDVRKQKALIVCGSCSKMTNTQVQAFKETDNFAIKINAKDIIDKKIVVDDIFNKIIDQLPKVCLVYSDGCENTVTTNLDYAKSMENFLSQLALKALNSGFDKIIVAGGETSGAVTLKLGFKSYIVGESVAPGVPVLIPFKNQSTRIILKSGNFGDKDFFEKAVEAK